MNTSAIPSQEAPADFLARAFRAVPRDPQQFSTGPTEVRIEPLHLSVTQTWQSGSLHNTHVIENGDLGVILSAKRKSTVLAGDVGTVVVSLGVDDDHDEVHYSARYAIGADEVLAQAIEALVTARWALQQASA